MRKNPFRHPFTALAAWSLLAGLAACNSSRQARADGPSSAPATAPLTAAVIPPPATQPLLAGVPGEMQAALTYLASDELEGRGLNTNGINLAASYIAGNFHGSGLKPLPGQRDYFQSFDVTTSEGLSPDSYLRAGESAYKPNADFSAAPLSGAGEFSGPVVFAGYGVTTGEKERAYDDYAGLDVKGKIVLIFRFEPADDQGTSRLTNGTWSEHAHLSNKIHNAVAHGAAGVIMLNPPTSKAVDALLSLDEHSMGGVAAIPFIQVKETVGAELLKRGGVADAKALETSIDTDFKPHSQALAGVSIAGKVVIKRTVRTPKNVIGYLPGVGPHADEYIVIGAHYDHLGRGEPGTLSLFSKEVHHGADDNGSGTTTVIELAHLMAESSRTQPLPRSVIFMCFSGEERGLLGSQYFVSHPLVPLDKIVAMLNLDMVGRLRGESLDVGPSGIGKDLDALLKKADEGSLLKLKPMGRFAMAQWASDHTSFALKKIPVLFFFTGLHADYHRPTDTSDKINYQGMAQIAELSERVIRGLAEMPKETLASSEAGLAPMMPGQGHAGATGGGGASLGVVPDYGSESSAAGVLIVGTSPGSAAEKAGLKAGDRITALGSKKTENLQELADVLSEAKPGDKVKVKIMRDKEEMAFDAVLGQRH